MFVCFPFGFGKVPHFLSDLPNRVLDPCGVVPAVSLVFCAPGYFCASNQFAVLTRGGADSFVDSPNLFLGVDFRKYVGQRPSFLPFKFFPMLSHFLRGVGDLS